MRRISDWFDCSAARRRFGRSFDGPLVCALIAVGCSAGSEDPASPASINTADSSKRVQVNVNDAGIDVRVLDAACAGSDCWDRQGRPPQVLLRLPHGQQLSTMADERGMAHFAPKLAWLFPSADVGSATVMTSGVSTDVNLGPLLLAMQRDYPEQWARLLEQRTERRMLADRSVMFTSKVFRNKNDNPLVMSCTPTGEEECFDGVDNDCDGRYDDVGCGYATGVLQWTLTWRADADLDLFVMGPDADEVHQGKRISSNSLLVLDRDCAGARSSQLSRGGVSVENVQVPAEAVPLSGTYQARVEVQRVGDSQGPIQGRLSGRIGKRTWYTDIELAPFPSVSYQVAFPIGADTDQDGIAQEHDACPEEKGCWFDDLAYRGCRDRDGDSVPDAIDACPEKTGSDAADPTTNGCPLEFGAAWVTNQGIQIQQRLEFATGRAELLGPAKAVIRDVAKAIRRRPDSATRLSIDGHTDDVGEATDNVALAQQRARAVLDELVRQGVPRESLTPRGFGETKPLADNTSPRGRQTNRRVEFVLLRPAPRTSECW